MIRALTLFVLIASQSFWVYAQAGVVICFHEDGRARTEHIGDSCCKSEGQGGHLGGVPDMSPIILADSHCECSDFAISSANPQVRSRVDIDPVLPVMPLLPSILEDFNAGLAQTLVFLPSQHSPPDIGPLAHLKTVVLRF